MSPLLQVLAVLGIILLFAAAAYLFEGMAHGIERTRSYTTRSRRERRAEQANREYDAHLQLHPEIEYLLDHPEEDPDL